MQILEITVNFGEVAIEEEVTTKEYYSNLANTDDEVNDVVSSNR